MPWFTFSVQRRIWSFLVFFFFFCRGRQNIKNYNERAQPLYCYIMLCYVMFCSVLFCCVVSCRVVSCRVVSCRVVLCYVMLCYNERAQPLYCSLNLLTGDVAVAVVVSLKAGFY